MLKYLHEKKYQTKKTRFAHTEHKAHQLELQGQEIGKSCKMVFFTAKRDQEKITHSLGALLKQRIIGICQGHENLNDPLLQYIYAGGMIKLQRQGRAP